MPRKITLQDMRQDPVIRKHMIGLILCGVALILDVAMSFSPMFWYHRYDVIRADSSNLGTLGARHLGLDTITLLADQVNTYSNDYNGYGGGGFQFGGHFKGFGGFGGGGGRGGGRGGGGSNQEQESSITYRVTTSIGLWQACSYKVITDKDPVKNCTRNDDKIFFLQGFGPSGFTLSKFAKSVGVTQLFQCLGLVFLTVAVTTTSLKVFFLWKNDFLVILGTAHAFWGAVCLIGSAGAFGVGLKDFSIPTIDFTENLHFSFAFAVISGIVALAGAIVLLIAAKSNESEKTSQMQMGS